MDGPIVGEALESERWGLSQSRSGSIGTPRTLPVSPSSFTYIRRFFISKICFGGFCFFFFYFVFPSFYAERETPTTRVKGVILENGTHEPVAPNGIQHRKNSTSTLRLSRRPRFIFPVGSRRRLCCVYLSLDKHTHTLGMVGGGLCTEEAV